MREIAVGVIGAGVLGAYHMGKCLKNPRMRLRGFFDNDSGRRSAVSEKMSATAYADLSALINDIDAVIVATPCSTHRAIAGACLAAGKHVLVEKPLAASYAEGLELVDLARQAGAVLHVGHSETYNAAITALTAFNPKPRFIEGHRLAKFSTRGTDVAVVLDLMVHDLHLLLRLCGEEPVAESIAATGVPVISADIDIANVRLTFPSGCVANLTASRISAKRMRKLRVFAKDNYYSADLDTGEVDHYYLTPAAPSPEAIPVAFEKKTSAPVDALETEQQAFIDAITGVNGIAGVDGKEAAAVLKITDRILELMAGQKI